jgi:hypothetical protein
MRLGCEPSAPATKLMVARRRAPSPNGERLHSPRSSSPRPLQVLLRGGPGTPATPSRRGSPLVGPIYRLRTIALRLTRCRYLPVFVGIANRRPSDETSNAG